MPFEHQDGTVPESGTVPTDGGSVPAFLPRVAWIVCREEGRVKGKRAAYREAEAKGIVAGR